MFSWGHKVRLSIHRKLSSGCRQRENIPSVRSSITCEIVFFPGTNESLDGDAYYSRYTLGQEKL